MSRKDTIIVAVLVNAGLLIVLFASALKSGGVSQPIALNSSAPKQELALKEEPFFPIKEKADFAAQPLAQSSIIPPTVVMGQTPSVNFVEDLKAFTLPEPSASVVESQSAKKSVAVQADHPPSVVEFKVKKGDVLEKIARHHHITVAELMRVNQLTSTNLKIGQVLKIPTSTAKLLQSSPEPVVSSQVVTEKDSSSKYYIVKKGDNPWTIAVKNHMKVDELLKLNHLSEEQARRLKPGDQLQIRP